MQHTPACEKHTARIEEQNRTYRQKWPRYCRKCRGYGIDSWSENQAPLGSGCYWPEQFSEPCAACWAMGKCPRCGRPMIQSLKFLSNQLNFYFHDVSDRFWGILERQPMPGYKSGAFGIAIDPWRGNVRRKLLYHTSGIFRKLGSFFKYQEEEVEKCLHCGWTEEADGLVDDYYCGCDYEQERREELNDEPFFDF